MLDQAAVEILAAEVGVTGGRPERDLVRRDREEHHAGSTTSKIEDEHVFRLRAFRFVQVIGDGRGHGLVDDAEDVEPGEARASLVARRWRMSNDTGTVTTALVTGAPR
jgi:hypothetical protein